MQTHWIRTSTMAPPNLFLQSSHSHLDACLSETRTAKLVDFFFFFFNSHLLFFSIHDSKVSTMAWKEIVMEKDWEMVLFNCHFS